MHIEKNKKNPKKIFIKIEKRQRSIRRQKKGCGLIFAPIRKTACNTSTKRTYRAYIALLFAYNMHTMVGTAFFAAFCALRSLLFVLMVICQHVKNMRLKVGFLRAARRLAFIYVFCAFFVFRSLFACFRFSLYFAFVCCCFPFLSFAFLSFCLLFLVLSFFALLYLHTCFLYIYNIINKYLLFRLCVCIYARARTTKARQNKAHKKGSAKNSAPIICLKIYSKCRIRCGLSSIRLQRPESKRAVFLPRLFRRR